ncbi:putative cadmium/zinc-transporting ATPase 3 [Hordeum vulgare]|nr:putative cadmium/zinc-transporting ATPase 3 [Hordeum vulgare]
MAEGDDPAAAAGGLTHVAAAAAISPATTAMPPPLACRPGLAPPRPVATAPAAKPTKGRGGGKRAANISRNPTDNSTRPMKLSKAVVAARGDESQPMRSAASSSSPTSIPQPPPPPPPTVEDDVATPTATASNMFDKMSQSLDDEAFMHATNVANDDYMYASQEYETQYDDDNLDVDDDGFVVKGRSGNYTTAEDVLTCTAWKKSLKMQALETTKRPDGKKKVKGIKAEDNDLKEGFDAIVMARKEYAEEKRILKLKEIEERSEAERRRAAAEEKRAAAEERLAAAEERKVELEEKKAVTDDRKMVEERTLKFMFMDTSTLDAKAKAYVELCCDEMLMKKQMIMRQMMMGGGMGGAMGGGMGGAIGGYMNMMGGGMNGAFGGNMGGRFGGNMEGDFSGMGGGFGDMGGGFGGNMMGGLGGGYGGNMSSVGVGFVGNMTGMGRNEDASGGAHGNESSLLVKNVDKEGGEDDDHTTVHKADGVDDPHE